MHILRVVGVLTLMTLSLVIGGLQLHTGKVCLRLNWNEARWWADRGLRNWHLVTLAWSSLLSSVCWIWLASFPFSPHREIYPLLLAGCVAICTIASFAVCVLGICKPEWLENQWARMGIPVRSGVILWLDLVVWCSGLLLPTLAIVFVNSLVQHRLI